MRTHRQEMQKSVEACIVLCTKFEAEKTKKELIKSEDIYYLELKLQNLTKSINGSRYKDIRRELLNMIDIVDSLSKGV